MKQLHSYRARLLTIIVCVSFTVGCSYVSDLRTKILGPKDSEELNEEEGRAAEKVNKTEDTTKVDDTGEVEDITELEDTSLVEKGIPVEEVTDAVNQGVEVSNARLYSGSTVKDNPTTLSPATSARGEKRIDDGETVPVVDSKPFILPGSIIPKTYITPQTSSKDGVSGSSQTDSDQ